MESNGQRWPSENILETQSCQNIYMISIQLLFRAPFSEFIHYGKYKKAPERACWNADAEFQNSIILMTNATVHSEGNVIYPVTQNWSLQNEFVQLHSHPGACSLQFVFLAERHFHDNEKPVIRMECTWDKTLEITVFLLFENEFMKKHRFHCRANLKIVIMTYTYVLFKAT